MHIMASHLHCGAGRCAASRLGWGRAAARSWAPFCGGASGSRAPRSRALVPPPCCTQLVVKGSFQDAGCAGRLHVDSAGRGGERRTWRRRERGLQGPPGPRASGTGRVRGSARVRAGQESHWRLCAPPQGRHCARAAAAQAPTAPATSGGRAPWRSCASAGWSAACAARCAGCPGLCAALRAPPAAHMIIL